jgi:hypothetical protein
MTVDDIKPGQRWKIVNDNNVFVGSILTISHIQDGSIVRFIEAPFEYFGAGVNAFLRDYELVSKDSDGNI